MADRGRGRLPRIRRQVGGRRRQRGRPRPQPLAERHEPRRDRAAQKVPGRSDHVDGDRGPGIDHDAGAAGPGEGREGRHEAVGARCFGRDVRVADRNLPIDSPPGDVTAGPADRAREPPRHLLDHRDHVHRFGTRIESCQVHRGGGKPAHVREGATRSAARRRRPGIADADEDGGGGLGVRGHRSTVTVLVTMFPRR